MKPALLALAIFLAIAFALLYFAIKYDAAIERAIEVAAQAKVSEILKDKSVLKIVCSR